MQTRKQNKSGVPTEELSKENKHVEKDKQKKIKVKESRKAKLNRSV